MGVGEYAAAFKYPAEEECLVRRLGAAVIASWPVLPEAVRDKLLAEAKNAWDREFYVANLGEKLETIARRRTR